MSRYPSLAIITLTSAILCSCGGGDLGLPGDGGPGDLVVVSGDGQEGKTGQRLDDPLVVQVNDDQGQPAEGAAVSFAGAAGSPAVSPANVTTDANGQASTRVTLGDAEGAQSIQAQVTGAADLSVEFHVTAVAPPGNPGGGDDPPGNGGGDDDHGKHRGKGGGHGGGGDGGED
jgi:hypothetical protein